MSGPPVLLQAPVTLRHVTLAAAGTTVVGATLAARPPVGVNGDRGYQSGQYEPALSEQGTASITLPNAVGEDGTLHRKRFRCLTNDSYEIGDEWIEVWEGAPGRGRALFVGTPVSWKKTRSTVALQLADGSAPLAAQRTFAAGFWTHAPRDVFEHYTKAWRVIVADDFTAGAGAAWTSSGTNLTGSVRLDPSGAGAIKSLIAVSGSWPALIPATTRMWRLETALLSLTLAGTGSFYLYLVGTDGGFAQIRLFAGYAETKVVALTGAPDVTVTVPIVTTSITNVAIEAHDRWVLFYINGRLVQVTETPLNSAGVEFLPGLNVTNGATGNSVANVDFVLLRAVVPYLMRGTDKGDYRLPGLPASGGLKGTYFDDADLRPVGFLADAYYRRILAPGRKPYAVRQDATVDFATATPPTWQPPTPASGEYFSVRWTGAIYLDLATADVTLRIAELDDAARLWVAKTMFGQQLVERWQSPAGAAPFTLTSGSLRTHTGGSLSGWYPIRMEYSSGAGTVGVRLQQSIGGGAYAAVPATSLSPFGVYEAEVRYDSHAEQVRALVETFGLQYRIEPRSLESGAFPGEMVPRIRVGRDTDKVLEPPESIDAEVSGSAVDAIATLLADAAGLADQANATQLTAEAVSFAQVWPAAAADRHLAVASGYESLADITDPNLLHTRLASMLALRSSPWEEVGARPRGAREIRDTYPPSFPLAGALALFDWEPGDGIRIVDPDLDVADETPRQIIAPAWPFGPDGRGAPTMRFRQRPRSQQDALRELIRAVLLPQRNFQGQLVAVDGTWSHLDGAGAYSRVALPRDAMDVVEASLIVTYKSDTSAWSLQDAVTAAVLIGFNTPGTFDLLPYVRRRTDAVGGSGQEFVVYRDPTVGTGTAIFTTRLVIRV